MGRSIASAVAWLTAVSSAARVTTVVPTLANWVCASALYRWLTAEPDPTVIVIDLRETQTIGPVISILEYTVDGLRPAVERSRTVAWGATLVTLGRAAPIRAASLVGLVALIATLLGTAARGRLDATAIVLYGSLAALACLGLRVDASWDELATSRVGRILSAVFAPPEPQTEQDQ